MGPWNHGRDSDLVLWVPPHLFTFLTPSPTSFQDFPHSPGLCHCFSSPAQSRNKGALAGASVPWFLCARPVPVAPCPARAPAEAFPRPAACPGRSVFPPPGRGEACFSSLLRNRASETHNAAVKISGSGWAAHSGPLVLRTVASSSGSQGGPGGVCLCWQCAGGGGRDRPPQGFWSSGVSTEEGTDNGCLQWSRMAHSKKVPT